MQCPLCASAHVIVTKLATATVIACRDCLAVVKLLDMRDESAITGRIELLMNPVKKETRH